MFKAFIQPAETALDVTSMATALAHTSFYYRALTETSEDFEWYQTPLAHIPAFSLSPDLISPFEATAYENFSATMRALLKWDGSRTPAGWSNYSNYEKLEFFGFWFKRTLTEISKHLLSERQGLEEEVKICNFF